MQGDEVVAEAMPPQLLHQEVVLCSQHADLGDLHNK